MHGLSLNRFLLIYTTFAFQNSNCWETGRFLALNQTSNKKPNVIVFDPVRSHSEVRFAMVQALASVPVGNFQVTSKGKRYQEDLIFNEIQGGAAAVCNPAHDSNIRWKYHKTLKNFVETRGDQEWAVILTSCDQGDLDANFKPNSKNYARICLAHYADMRGSFSKDQLQREFINYNYTFLTLSHHVTTGLQKYLRTVTTHPPPTYTFVPVFAYNRSEKFVKNWLNPTIVVQGGIESQRRDYETLFDSIRKNLHGTPQLKIQLVGANKEQLKIPKDLADNLEIHSNLPYPEYYDLISRAIAIVPAFQTGNAYLVNKASSTIPVSIITCVPIIADDKILEAYTYLNQSVVWFRKSNETEMDTLIRYFKKENFKALFKKKRQLLKELRKDLIKQNSALLEKIIFKTQSMNACI